MNARSLYVLKKLALVAGLAAHVMAPIAIAAAPASFDIASLICAPSGEVSREARAALTEMLALAGEEPGETESAAKGHCGACVISTCAIASSPQLELAIAFTDTHHHPMRSRDNVHPSVHGPPLGLRAPPVFLTTL